MISSTLFNDYCDELAAKYGLDAYWEHESVVEFFEGDDLPLFKLIFGPSTMSEGKNVVISTFNIEVDPVDAIQWFLRIRGIISDIRLQESYYKDDQGETFLGENAYQIRMYKDEQRILAEYLESDRDEESTKSYTKGKVYGRRRNKKKIFNDTEAALEEFHRIVIPDEDEIQ